MPGDRVRRSPYAPVSRIAKKQGTVLMVEGDEIQVLIDGVKTPYVGSASTPWCSQIDHNLWLFISRAKCP